MELMDVVRMYNYIFEENLTIMAILRVDHQLLVKNGLKEIKSLTCSVNAKEG